MITKDKIIKNIILRLQNSMEIAELRNLEEVLRIELHGIVMEEECTELSTDVDDNDYILQLFVANKKLEGISDTSIRQYVIATRKLFDAIRKNYKNITTDDIKYHLAIYKGTGVCENSVVNMKRFISSFFSWADDEGYIPKNPCKAIKNMRQVQKKKEFLTQHEIEVLRDISQTPRERALIDFLLSTGLRVSELTSLNISDINFQTDTVNVYSQKTRTYREAYLNAKAKKHIIDYLNSRTDENAALFVGEKAPHRRMEKGGINLILRDLASRGKINKHCTVHLFRKTLATTMLKNGARLEHIKEILGHSTTATTEKNYASMDKTSVKYSFDRYAA